MNPTMLVISVKGPKHVCVILLLTKSNNQSLINLDF